MKAPSHTLCLALAAVWLACATTAQAQERIPIVTTTTDLRSLTEAVGGDRVAVTSLVPPNMDAEEYQPKPQDVLRLRAARLLVRVGLDYDLWLDRLLLQAGRREIIRGASGYVDASLRTLDFSPAERATFAGACAERYRVEAEQLTTPNGASAPRARRSTISRWRASPRASNPAAKCTRASSSSWRGARAGARAGPLGQ